MSSASNPCTGVDQVQLRHHVSTDVRLHTLGAKTAIALIADEQTPDVVCYLNALGTSSAPLRGLIPLLCHANTHFGAAVNLVNTEPMVATTTAPSPMAAIACTNEI